MKIEIRPLRAALRHLAHPARRTAWLMGSSAPFVCTVWETDPEPATGCGGDVKFTLHGKVPLHPSPDLLDAIAHTFRVAEAARAAGQKTIRFAWSGWDFAEPEVMIPPEKLWTRVDGRGLPIQPPLAPPAPCGCLNPANECDVRSAGCRVAARLKRSPC